MWFGSPEDSNRSSNRKSSRSFSVGDDRGQETIQGIINSTSCFDLMRNSSKIVLFETSIPFHLAFLALTEHDIEVAPLWDGIKGGFVGLMTTSDFTQAVKISFDSGGSPNLMRCTIAELLRAETQYFVHSDFNSIDAEDSVHQLCASLLRYDVDYIPVVDPDEGSLVAILGYMDILFLLIQMTDKFPMMFSVSVETSLLSFVKNVPTVPRSTPLSDVFDIIDDRNVKCVAVSDATGRCSSLYQLSDIAFMCNMISDTLLQDFSAKSIGDVVEFRNDFAENVSESSLFCCGSDSIKNLVEKMVHARTTKLLCMDGAGEALGIITVRDIISYIFDGDVDL